MKIICLRAKNYLLLIDIIFVNLKVSGGKLLIGIVLVNLKVSGGSACLFHIRSGGNFEWISG